ncbi:MAG: NUDIX domain-containing protein [Bdellovibrionales bacterium]|nr:NUDIX domain-containing protein [Bdellovibrionales bacterium]
MDSKLHKKVQVWIVNRTSKGDLVLLFKVIPKRGAGWHPVTGSVEDDEAERGDWLGAAKRETREETGLHPRHGKWVDLELSFKFDGRWGPAEEFCFALILNDFSGAITLDPSEHEGMKWVSLKEAEKALGFDSQRRALQAISCYLAEA